MTSVFNFLSNKKQQVLFISLLWALLAILINPVGEFPFNDDWAYAQSVKVLVEKGTFFFSSWTAVNLIAQIGWGALFCLPFGFSFTALRISTLVAGLFGLWGTYQLLDKATDSRKTAFIGTLLTLVNPLYLNLSATFMTDIPFYALTVWSLSYLVTGLKQDSTRQLIIGLLLAVVALLIRQFGIILFVGFSVAYVARKNFAVKSLVVAFASALTGVLVQAIYQKWLEHVLEGTGHVYNAQANNFLHLSYYKLQLIAGFIHNTFIALMYLGLFMFPYFLLLLTKSSQSAFRKNIGLWLLLTGIVIGLWQYFFDGMNMPIWWNTISAFGLGPVLLRDIYFRLYGFPLPSLLYFITVCSTICSLLGSVGLLFYMVRAVKYLARWPLSVPQRTIGILMVSVGGIYFFPLGLQGLFDRYLLLLPVLIIVLVHIVQQNFGENQTDRPRRLPLYLSIGLFVAYALFSVTGTHDYLAWNRVRWQALGNLMKDGVLTTQIDGGFEFNGWYLYESRFKPTPGKSWWWVHDDTYVVGASVLPGYSLFQQHKVDSWLPWGMTHVIIGKKNEKAPLKSTS
ncbi:glycosyltransferase family 39 protein [Spirosoma endophyticum]|uniref:4-amino-4-deoxy-L-arabinose transferase n=1 Tax=Spirosoma endophyticum TaxID=662367 RepID=A0A1I1GNP1_9BACT|nr:glycosyltransferase family 39 protein [Spirosoma endophyticum]SFC13244.1 4-amino-4-deoxy-L-arabinose transferase [Spirosoma endophyticum]